MAPNSSWNPDLTIVSLIYPCLVTVPFSALGKCPTFWVGNTWEHQTSLFPASCYRGDWNDQGSTKQMQSPLCHQIQHFWWGRAWSSPTRLSGVSPCALLCRFPEDWECPHPSQSIPFLLGDNSWCLGCCLLSPKASILPSFLLTEAGWLGWQCAQIKIFIFLDSCSQGWKPLGGAPGKA